VVIGRERLRQLLRDNGVSWQRTRTWKESNDPDFDVKLDRIEEVTTRFPQRCFAFDQFGPLSIRPHHGGGLAPRKHPDRLPATYKRTHGIRYFHGCYSFADDRLWGVMRRRKGDDHTLSALKSIRPARPDGAPIYVILDNLSANKTPGHSNHPNHTVLARAMQTCLRWRNANARHPDVLVAQRCERARVRSERQHRWGRPRTKAA
jgi:hypothetical protein